MHSKATQHQHGQLNLMRHTNCLQSSIGNRRICKSINSDIKTRRQVQWVGISYGRTSSCIYTEPNEKKDDVYNKYFYR